MKEKTILNSPPNSHHPKNPTGNESRRHPRARGRQEVQTGEQVQPLGTQRCPGQDRGRAEGHGEQAGDCEEEDGSYFVVLDFVDFCFSFEILFWMGI